MAAVRIDEERLQAWTDLVLSYNQIVKLLEREMQSRVGITLSQYDVLLRLHEASGNRMKMSELAEAIVYSTGGLTRVIERMRQAGLVQRETLPTDRRVVFASLTHTGQERLRQASAVHLDGVRRHFASHLPDDELATVSQFLSRLHSKHPARPRPAARPATPHLP